MDEHLAHMSIPQQPSRRIVLLSKLKTTTMRLGARTQAFFRKGDQLEATGFENLPHDDPTLVPPKLGFRGFDRVPRNRAPILIALLLVAAAAVAAFRWGAVHDVPHGTARVASSVGTKVSSEWDRLKAMVRSRRAAP
jgi:hypothetical protein